MGYDADVTEERRFLTIMSLVMIHMRFYDLYVGKGSINMIPDL